MNLTGKSTYTPKNATHLFLCGAVLSSVASALLVLIFRQQIHSSIVDACASFAPSEPQNTPTVFEENYSFQTLDREADERWKDLVTPNGGFFIDESREDAQVYGIAMFHQLHCVQMFRMDYQELFARLADQENGSKKRNASHHSAHQMDMQHTLHCLDYLRQVFLCYADGAIEPTMDDPKGGVPKTNGMVPHSCRNPSIWYEMSLRAHWSSEHEVSMAHDHGLSGHSH